MKKLLLFIMLCSLPAPSFQAVDVNSATAEQIALLPGVGAKLAENIYLLRKKRGSLSSMDDLSGLSGMTTKKAETIKRYIIFGAIKVKTKNSDVKVPPPPQKITLPPKPVMDLAELEANVLAFHQLSLEFDQSLQHRARLAAWLPKLSTIFDVDHGVVTTKKEMEHRTDALHSRGGNEFGFGVHAIFDLDKLIFNRDELEIAKLSLKRGESRDAVLAKVHQHYFRYLRLNERTGQPLDVETAQEITREMKEIEFILDSLSNGRFTERNSS